MALASSIGKQIAPGVYEDLSKKKTIPQNTGINVDQSQALYGAGLSAPQPPIQQPTETQAPGWIGQPKKVATTQNPVITRSAPAPTPMTPPQTDITSWDDNQIKDFVAWAELNPSKLSVEDQFKLKRGQQVLQERAYQQTNINPFKEQITQEETLRKQREAELKQRDTELMDARRRELELTYGKRIAGQQEAGQKTMNAAQGVLSFSGFGRSTYAAEKQAEIQQQVNENINILNAERDYAIAKYEAELRGATAEELASYDQNIADLRNKSAQFSVQLAQQMNEYNMQTAASYEERINNVLQLAQSLETVELTQGQQEEAGAYATLLIDNEGNINEKLLADIPPTLKGVALRKAAETKSSIPKKMEAPKTASDGIGNLYSFNEETGEREIIGKGKSQVQLEEITLPDGTKQTVQFDPTTGTTTPVMGGTTGDLRGLANQFPGQARAKNNNPAGITWNENFDKGLGTAALLQQAGIRYEKGTARPANEGGNYVTFPTIEEGLAAQRILMTQTYGNSTVQQMLGKWVGTGEALNYAKQVAGNAGVPLNVKVNQLDEQQLSALQMAKIQKESPGLAKLLGQGKTTPDVGGYEPQTVEEEQLLNSIQQSKGKKVLPAGTVSMLSDGKGLPKLVSNLTGLINKNISKFGPIAGRLGGWNEYDTEAQKAQSQLKLAAQTVGKFMEGGVLRKEDEIKYEKMLPTLKDTPEVALSKVEQVKALLENKYKGYIQDFSNSYDVTGFPVTLFTKTGSEKPIRYTPNTDYPAGTIVEKDGVMYSVGKDGNFYEQ